MSELRFNRITGDWVIIATERAHPPEDFVMLRDTNDPPAHVGDCPFCPGNEAMSKELSTIERGKSWGVRLVRNKFPALSPGDDKRKTGTLMQRSMNGFGYHDVIIEHPEHNRWLWRQPADGIADVLNMVRRRYIEIASDSRVELAVPFKNHGRSSGTSILHPHIQIVGTPVMPADVRRRLWNAIRYYDEHSQ